MENQTTHEGSRIVVGVDGSPESVLALKWAKTLAAPLGATIVAVTAWHFETTLGPYVAAQWDPEADARKILRDALAEAFAEQPPDGLSGQVDRGRPAQVLLAAGQSALMLIVGSRGHGGFTGMLLGSVSSACAEHANCPVLVVHSGPASLAGGDAEHEVAREPTNNV